MRVVVRGCEGLDDMDTLTMSNDAFVEGKLLTADRDGKAKQQVRTKSCPPTPSLILQLWKGTRDRLHVAWCALFHPYISRAQVQVTDTHWKAQGGAANFNWRMVYPVSLPAAIAEDQPARLMLEVKDSDPMTLSSDMIGYHRLNLRSMLLGRPCHTKKNRFGEPL